MEGIVHLSAGVVCQQNYQKMGPRVSAADFIPGVEMEGDMLGREEVKAGADDMEMEGDTLGREKVKAGADDVIGFMLGWEEVEAGADRSPVDDMEGIVHLSAGVVCQQDFKEPGVRGSAADFIPGVEMEGDKLGRRR